MKQKALIISGGWDGHEPYRFSTIFKEMLKSHNYEVHIITSLDFSTLNLNEFDLIIPNWTMGDLSNDNLLKLITAVRNGTGVAGIHGGMGDAFRSETEYQYMVGGQFVAHPGGQEVQYEVMMADPEHGILKEITNFTIKSERYYLHFDPAIHIIAYTPIDNIKMPVMWTKEYEKGKVFYCSIGHHTKDLDEPNLYRAIKQGFLWASRNNKGEKS